MGREVRRVPADWQHPKHLVGGFHGLEERYKPIFDGARYQPDVDEWDTGLAEWKAGRFPEHADAEDKLLAYEQWTGQRPHKDDYMPDWPESEKTHLMMYEDTSEGTPISPAFKTPEELARWLADNGASALGSETASYEGWLKVCKGGWAPSLVISNGVMQNGVDFLKED